MMRFLYLILITFVFISCDKKSKLEKDSFEIKGKVNYLREGYVKVVIRDGEGVKVLDSAIVADDSSFVLQGKIPIPQYAQIIFFDKQSNIFPLTSAELIIRADGNSNEGLFKVSGSDEVELHNYFSNYVKMIQNEMMELRQKMTYAMGNNNEAEANSIRNELLIKLNNQNDWIKHFVDSLGTGNLVAGFAMVNYLNPIEQFDYFDAKVKEIQAKDNPNDFEIRFMSEFNNKRTEIEKVIAENSVKKELDNKLQIGKVMPEIELPDANGKNLKLSDFRGKVVLVDFWAGWCRPCRAENPNLVAAYNAYHKKGFEIYGVSLDRTKEQWLQAIEQDGITWPQVSDLAYWNSAVVKEFNITGIPANFLINENGVIIGKNLRGQALQQKIAEIFANS